MDAVFDSGTLAGKNPEDRVRIQDLVRSLDRTNSKTILPSIKMRRLKKDATTHFYQECRAVANATDKEGPYFLGQKFSLVDVAFVPFWHRMMWVEGHYFGLEFPDEPDFDRIHMWWEACKQRASV